MTAEERRAPENGIWLCATCGQEIDKDPERFPVSLRWKLDAEQEARVLLARPSYRVLGIARPAFDPPLEYQLLALRQILKHLRRSGVAKLAVSQLAQVVPNPILRDGINPIFESLTVESVTGALDRLLEVGELQLDGQTAYAHGSSMNASAKIKIVPVDWLYGK